MGAQVDQITLVSNDPLDEVPSGPVDKKDTAPDTHLDAIEFGHSGKGALGDKAARAGIEQHHLIPTTGVEPTTSKWERISFMVFRMSVGGAAITTYGSSRNQQFLNLAFPKGKVPFAGRQLTVNAYLLDLNGMAFAAQLVVLLILGPYADYGSWRPYILIALETVVYVCCFALAGLSDPATQWRAANAIWFLGNLALNVANVFYYAGFAAIVRNLPEVRQSEADVFEGKKTPEEHDELDSLNRAKFYNYCIVTASTINLTLLAIAIGIAAGIGIKTTAEVMSGYRYLIIFFAILEICATTPFMIIFLRKKRPGQRLPDDTSFLMAGPKQLWRAARYAWDLKQFLLYLAAYFLFQEAAGSSANVQTILQNQTIKYSTIQLSGLTALDYFTGATGTLFVSVLQQRYKFRTKSVLLYGMVMTLVPMLWGGIGAFTKTIGFHHVWEFWLANVWNFQMAAFNSYYVVLLSEVVPQPKMYMFFALLNIIGKSSGFTGPFISSAIITRAGGNTNMAYWFLLGLGILGTLLVSLVDVRKAKIDVARFLEREADQLYDPATVQ